MGSKMTAERLSNFEWEIMNQIWSLGSASAREVLEALPTEHQRAYTTIQTYLERLVEKKYLSKEKLGLVNYYSAIIPKESAVHRETKRFVDQVFSGSTSQLAAYLLGQGTIEPADLESIKLMLEADHD